MIVHFSSPAKTKITKTHELDNESHFRWNIYYSLQCLINWGSHLQFKWI